MQIEALGDSALLVSCASDSAAAALAAWVEAQAWPEVQEVVVAYCSLAIYFDPVLHRPGALRERLRSCTPQLTTLRESVRRFEIPCCYELGPDLAPAAERLNLEPTQLIEIHSAAVMTVAALGFSPGFPYLSGLPVPLHGLPRHAPPRKRVEPGSVGITGKQGCIYPAATPGGWHLIGRTPLELVDLDSGYFALAAGDQIRFVPIAEERFHALLGQRPRADENDGENSTKHY